MLPPLRKTLRVALPLAGLLFPLLAACTPHERFHRDLYEVHEQFHERPHTRAEHSRFHETVEDLHRDYHDRNDDYD